MTQNILIIGDLYIPVRACAIPAPFKTKLTSEVVQAIVCTDYLRSISPEILQAHGSLDEMQCAEFASQTYGLNIYKQSAEQNGFVFGTINGYQTIPISNYHQLSKYAIMNQVDVLCASGPLGIELINDKIIVRPGSLTGVYDKPSFVLAQISDVSRSESAQ